MAIKRRTKVEPAFSMSSMTDIVFLLLIFFLVPQAIPFSDVEPALQLLLRDSDDPTFSIYADRTVPIEEVVNLMNIAKRNQYKVILATAPE